jgi:hypothetical protein
VTGPDAWERACAAVDAAPDAHARALAWLDYAREVVAASPAELIEHDDPRWVDVRAAVMRLTSALLIRGAFLACDHSQAYWCAEAGCYATYWRDPEDPARSVPLEHRHCRCQGVQRGGQPWSL